MKDNPSFEEEIVLHFNLVVLVAPFIWRKVVPGRRVSPRLTGATFAFSSPMPRVLCLRTTRGRGSLTQSCEKEKSSGDEIGSIDH